jgi:hypothetical protein
MHKTQLHFNPTYFQLKYLGYWSQTTNGRVFTAETTAKVNCKLHSQ